MPLTYPTPKFVVLHGHPDAAPVLVAYEPPAKISTGHPQAEAFDDPQAAIERAIELGVPPEGTVEFWPVGQHLDEHHRLVDDPTYAPSDEPSPPPAPEPIEIRLSKVEQRLGQLEGGR